MCVCLCLYCVCIFSARQLIGKIHKYYTVYVPMDESSVGNPEWTIPNLDPDPGKSFVSGYEPSYFKHVWKLKENVLKSIKKKNQPTTITFKFEWTFHCIFCTIKEKKERIFLKYLSGFFHFCLDPDPKQIFRIRIKEKVSDPTGSRFPTLYVRCTVWEGHLFFFCRERWTLEATTRSRLTTLSSLGRQSWQFYMSSGSSTVHEDSRSFSYGSGSFARGSVSF